MHLALSRARPIVTPGIEAARKNECQAKMIAWTLHVYRSPCSTESDDDIVLWVLREVARLHGEYLILGDYNAPHVNWLMRSCSMTNSFSNQLLTAADEEFLHQAVTSPTRYRTGQLPSILDLVFFKYSSSIHSINHLVPLGKSGHATLQVNFAASDLPAGKSKPKLRFNKANTQGLLCAANSIDWASISQMAHVNDQWYHMNKSILLLQDRFVPFGPMSQWRAHPWLREKRKLAQKSKQLAFIQYKSSPWAYTFKVYLEESNKLPELMKKQEAE